MKGQASTPNRALERNILQILQSRGQPLGCGSLQYFLRQRGSQLSAPTVGRKLRDLEDRGFVVKVSVEGRILTTSGQRLLRELEREQDVACSNENVLKLLKRGSKKDIVDQLVARRVIEGEACALAAAHASPRDLTRLGRIVERQQALVERGEMGVAEDITFHDVIVKASRNAVLAAMVAMLRSHERLNSIVAAIRSRVGTRLVVDHEEIIKALRARKPELARRAMEEHINRLIIDVNRYWGEVFPERRRYRNQLKTR